MWNGMLSPNFVKHHMRAKIKERVRVKTNPITEEDFDSPRIYHKVDVDWPTTKDPSPPVYTYLIPAAKVAEAVGKEFVQEYIADNTPLTEDEVEEIWRVVQEYNRNRLEYARDWREYLADTEPEALDSLPEALL